jgi:prophage antirepressor-like protein
MSNELITIQNVRAYIDSNGIAQLNLEDVSRGLGFTTVATSGNECVRWSRVTEYLNNIGHYRGDALTEAYIPENIFYRLAMKANNETAISFQEKIANEILPSIRKHGMYAKDELLDNPDLMIEVLQELKKEREEKKLLQTENKLLSGATLAWADRKILEAIVKAYGASIHLPEINGFQEAWRDFKKELLYNYSINLNARISKQMENSTRKTKPKTMDMIHDDELPKCISTAVALCKSHNVDISDILGKYKN